MDDMTSADAPLRWMAEHAGADGSTDVLALGRPPAGVRLALRLVPSAAVAVLAGALTDVFHGHALAVVVGILAFLFCVRVPLVGAAAAGEPDAREPVQSRVIWSVRIAGARLMALMAIASIAFLSAALTTFMIEWMTSTYVATGAYAFCQTVSPADATRGAVRTGLYGMLATLGLVLPFAGLRETDRPPAAPPTPADPPPGACRRSPLRSAIRPGGGVIWVATLGIPVVIAEHYIGTALAGLPSAEAVPMFHSLPPLRFIPRIGVAWRDAVAAAPAGTLFPSLVWCVLAVAAMAVIAYAVAIVAESPAQTYRWLALRSFARQAGITGSAERFLAEAVDAGLVTRQGDRYAVVGDGDHAG
jgi:hypothetical protein